MRSAVLALIAATVLPASAVAGTSHAVNWLTPGQKVVCGVAEQVPGTAVDPGTMAPQNGRWPGLQCSAVGIPRPRQGIGDPFVQLGQGRAGRARLVDESQDDLKSNAPFMELPAATTWERYGIACTVRTTSVRCTNSAGHGFTMSPGHAHLF